MMAVTIITVGAIHADLNLEKTYTPFRAYAQSKLANVLFTKELARRLKGTWKQLLGDANIIVKIWICRYVWRCALRWHINNYKDHKSSASFS